MIDRTGPPPGGERATFPSVGVPREPWYEPRARHVPGLPPRRLRVDAGHRGAPGLAATGYSARPVPGVRPTLLQEEKSPPRKKTLLFTRRQMLTRSLADHGIEIGFVLGRVDVQEPGLRIRHARRRGLDGWGLERRRRRWCRQDRK